MLKMSVLVPTYRRPRALERCLEALKRQTRPADEVVVVIRDSDRESRTFLETFDATPLPLQVLSVSRPGQVAALNAGLDRVRGEAIAITDDDAEPRPRWLEAIEAHFLADERVGGVGGRDLVYLGDRSVEGTSDVVGRIQWFGRIVGNHHLGAGKPREVDLLKGANMSYRRKAIENIRFDERLKGTGAQVGNDMAFSLAVKRSGWKLIYDPEVAVDHRTAERFDEDDRDSFDEVAVTNRVHNETLILLEHLSPLQRFTFLCWAILVGTTSAPGIAQWSRLFPDEGELANRKLRACFRGLWQGYRTWRSSISSSTSSVKLSDPYTGSNSQC